MTLKGKSASKCVSNMLTINVSFHKKLCPHSVHEFGDYSRQCGQGLTDRYDVINLVSNSEAVNHRLMTSYLDDAPSALRNCTRLRSTSGFRLTSAFWVQQQVFTWIINGVVPVITKAYIDIALPRKSLSEFLSSLYLAVWSAIGMIEMIANLSVLERAEKQKTPEHACLI